MKKLVLICTCIIISLTMIMLVISHNELFAFSGISKDFAVAINNFLVENEFQNSTMIYETEIALRKIAHFAIYMLICFVCMIAISFIFKNVILSVMLSAIVSIVIAVVDEFLFQAYWGMRTPSVFDLLIDMAGILSISIIILFWELRRKYI